MHVQRLEYLFIVAVIIVSDGVTLETPSKGVHCHAANQSFFLARRNTKSPRIDMLGSKDDVDDDDHRRGYSHRFVMVIIIIIS